MHVASLVEYMKVLRNAAFIIHQKIIAPYSFVNYIPLKDSKIKFGDEQVANIFSVSTVKQMHRYTQICRPLSIVAIYQKHTPMTRTLQPHRTLL